MRLHVFGDSYSTPDYCVDKVHSWWGLLAQDLGIPVTNWSWPTNSVECIVQTIFCNQDHIQKDDKIVIALPPIGRALFHDPQKHLMQHAKVLDQNLVEQEQIPIFSHSGMHNISVSDAGKDFVLGWSGSYYQAVAIRNMLLIDSYFQQDILIVNASIPFVEDTQWPPLKFMLDRIRNLDNVDLYNTYYSVNKDKNKPVDFDQWKWHGHHGEAGNHEWYEKVIKPLTTNLGWQ